MQTSPVYNTILGDVLAYIISGKPSAPDLYDPSTGYESMLMQMLRNDRGGNLGPPITSLNPLDHFTSSELQSIYARFIVKNPFDWLFASPNHQYPTHPALLATIVGWNFYERSRNQSSTPLPAYHHMTTHMSYFEFAEEELMRSTLSDTEDGLSIVQGLVLLAAFRTIDAQPRCGFALFNTAHLLARHHSKGVQSEKRPGREDQTNGLAWLLALICAFTALSLDLTPTNVGSNLLRCTPPLPDCTHAGQEWAGCFLVEASQLLDVFGTLSKEEANSRHPHTLTRWLAQTAVSRGHQAGEKSNSTLAFAFSLLALNKLNPFTHLPVSNSTTQAPLTAELLWMATHEGLNASYQLSPSGALSLKLLRSAFPYLLLLIHATTLYIHPEEFESQNQLELAVESLNRFVESGLSLRPDEDRGSVEQLLLGMSLMREHQARSGSSASSASGHDLLSGIDGHQVIQFGGGGRGRGPTRSDGSSWSTQSVSPYNRSPC